MSILNRRKSRRTIERFGKWGKQWKVGDGGLGDIVQAVDKLIDKITIVADAIQKLA